MSNEKEVAKVDPEIEKQYELLDIARKRLSLEKNELALSELADSSKIPKSMNGKLALSAQFAASSLLPDGYQGKPDNCFIALQYGEMLGFGNPLSCFQNIYIVKNKPTASSDSMIGCVFNHPDFIDYEHEGNEKTSTTTIIRRLRNGKEKSFSRTHTLEMSKDKLQSFPQWKSDPENMLKHRSDSKCCRSAFPEIFAGLHNPDELNDRIEIQDGSGQIVGSQKIDKSDIVEESKEGFQGFSKIKEQELK